MTAYDSLCIGLIIGVLVGFFLALLIQALRPQQPSEPPPPPDRADEASERRRPPRRMEQRLPLQKRIARVWTPRAKSAHLLGDDNLRAVCQKLLEEIDQDGKHYFVRADFAPVLISDTQYRAVRGMWLADDILHPGSNKRVYLSPTGMQFCSDIVTLVPEQPTTTHPPESGGGGLPEASEGAGFHPYYPPIGTQ